MAGFGIGAVVGHFLFGSASPANLLGTALGLCLVLFLQRRGTPKRLPLE